MNKEEFYSEAINSNLLPNFKEIYNKFSDYQSLALDILKEFHNVCELNSIPYQLFYGSLLGVIRDNGQIPWDGDIDVIVPYNMKDSLISALEKSLSDKYYFYCTETNKDCRHLGLLRIAPKGYFSECLHLDVFYSFNLPNDKRQEKELKEKICKIIKIHYYKKLHAWIVSRKKIKSFIYLLLLKLRYLFYNTDKLKEEFEELVKKYQGSGISTITFNGYMLRDSFQDSQLWDLKKITTSIGSYFITKNYDVILKQCYRNYNEILPLEKRLNQILGSYNKITFFENLSK